MTRVVHGFQSVSYRCFILTYFNISRSRSQLLCQINVSKDFANFTKKIFVEVLFKKLQAYNHFPNILRLFDVLPNFPFTTSETMKRCAIITYKHSIYELPHLRLRILGN